MTVAQFCESMPPIMDGVGMVTAQYARWLNRKYGKTVAVTVAIPGHSDDSALEVEVLRVPSFSIPGMPPYRSPFPSLSPKVQKRLDELPLDILHAHAPFILGHAALKIARDRNIPIITTFHSKYRDDFEKAIPGERLQQAAVDYIVRFYHQVDEVWVPNQATIETIREYGYEGPVEVVYNGTDLELPDDLKAYRDAGSALVKACDEAPMLLYIGQHRWEKNLRLMLESLRIVREQIPGFVMVFAGQGYAEKELKALTQTLGLESQVRFLGVVRERELIKQLYARSDLFLFPSLYDTSPLTLRESAAFHVPTVLVEGASATEGITDGENGFVAADSAEAFAAKILEALSDSDLRKMVGTKAHDTLFRTWEHVADEVHDRYQSIIDRRAAK